MEPTRSALFVNSGILGQRTFAHFIRTAFSEPGVGIRATQIVVADDLSFFERVFRRLLCLRLWPAGARRSANLDFFRFRAELHAGLVARRRIAQLEREGERFQVLHFHHQATAYASLDRIRATPTIISIDCTPGYVVQGARSPLEARTYAPNIRRDGEIFKAADLIISTSRWAASCVREEYPDCTTDIQVMPLPVRLESFDPGWIEARHHRALADPSYRPRVLFMGGDFARKGGFDLLDAWQEADLGERASLDIVTSEDVAVRSLPGVRIHTGVEAYSARWRELWREADIFVLPTRSEAFGLVFQEAAAAGLPAIGTRITAIPETVVDGNTGLLVDPGDRPALAEALAHLIDSPELRRAMGTRAQERIGGQGGHEAYRRGLADAIHRLAGQARRH